MLNKQFERKLFFKFCTWKRHVSWIITYFSVCLLQWGGEDVADSSAQLFNDLRLSEQVLCIKTTNYYAKNFRLSADRHSAFHSVCFFTVTFTTKKRFQMEKKRAAANLLFTLITFFHQILRLLFCNSLSCLGKRANWDKPL